MNIRKQDIQELRRRMKKTECSITRLRGWYINSGKQVVVELNRPFLDLEEDEFSRYLEIAKKVLSGTLGNNLLELAFSRTEAATERQTALLALKDSKLQDDALANGFFEQIRDQFGYPGNYLVLLYHDAYDVIKRATDDTDLDESEEVYEYLLGAICPVELSKEALGYRESENRIGSRERDWVVGMPDLGFIYPAFANRGTDLSAVLYYVRTGRESHAEFIEQVLGCVAQHTAAEERGLFHSLVQEAFGEDHDSADVAFLHIQKNLGELAAEQQDAALSSASLTADSLAEVIAGEPISDKAQQQITQLYTEYFGETPPTVDHLLDSKLAAEGARRAHIAHLEQQVIGLKERLATQSESNEAAADPTSDTPPISSEEDTPPWEEAAPAIHLQVSADKATRIKAEQIDGQRFLLIPWDDGEPVILNGTALPDGDRIGQSQPSAEDGEGQKSIENTGE